MSYFFLFLTFILISLAQPNLIFSQQSQGNFEAKIIEIKEEKEVKVLDKKQIYQKLELLILNGKDQKIIVENGNIPVSNNPKFKLGDIVVVSAMKDQTNNDLYIITDFVRRDALIWLFVIFITLTILVGKKRGLTSIIGMGISFLIIFKFILPQISGGQNPIFIAIVASIFIIPITFYLSHGLNKKTTAAVLGTFIALIITGLLANFFVEIAKLSGFASEEAGFLQVAKQGLINIKGLLLAGIIVSSLGILDDITISQSSIVYQLKKATPNIPIKVLYEKAMEVGKDHIASVVNTLVLVYTGAALPLLLLFIDNPRPFGEIINYEIVAEEVVKTLVASIGLILAVPITTLISALFISIEKPNKKQCIFNSLRDKGKVTAN